MFLYSDDNKRYHTMNYHLRHKFGGKTVKISLDAGFTCPNIDGKCGLGGCIYCSASGSGDFAGNKNLSLSEQYNSVRKNMSKKWASSTHFIPYLQAHTNTYAPLKVLRTIYEEILRLPDVCGLAIATRADCIDEEIADYLLDISKRTYLTVELGLQTIHDKTANFINRCHTFNDFLKGYNLLSQRGIFVCVHLINGLPGESREMMLESAQEVSKLNPHCLKFHLLYVLEGTDLNRMYKNGEFKTLTREEYVDVVVSQLETISPEIIIERLTGDGKKEDLTAPLWSEKKFCVLNEIDKEFVRRDTYQGIYKC